MKYFVMAILLSLIASGINAAQYPNGYGGSIFEAIKNTNVSAERLVATRGQGCLLEPANPDTCIFEEESKLWKCTAKVANHSGSCAKYHRSFELDTTLCPRISVLYEEQIKYSNLLNVKIELLEARIEELESKEK